MQSFILDGVSFTHDGRPLLTDLSLTAAPGQRVALIGENGSGKSTVLHLAAGALVPQSGTIVRPSRVGMLHQHLPFRHTDSVGDVLERALVPTRTLLADLDRAAEALAHDPGAGARYATLLDEAEQVGAWTIEPRVEAALAGLGLAEVSQQRTVTSLSGGQRSRLALASLLLERPIGLLLDEPTNHLDDTALDFLAGELSNWGGPVLFASHDRHFLDTVATRIVDLDPASSAVGELRVGVTTTGRYSDYLAQRESERRAWDERFGAERQRINELRHEVAHGARQVFHTSAPKTEQRGSKKFYSDKASATIARRVNRARASLEQVEREQVRKPPSALRFTGFGGRPLDGDEVLVSLQQVSVNHRLAELSLDLRGRDRVLVTGANGSGKSTLVSVVNGTLRPDQGRRLVRRGLRIGTLTQDTTPTDLDATPAELFQDVGRSLSDLGLVAGRDQHRPLGELSLGTRKRVELARLVADPPHLLLLDEPTNHLALGLAEELERALDEFPGAVLIASHDRWLRQRWRGQVITLGQD
ncbi:ABC-F family ATP-binding cassette domain-containing protein [Aestuariimicrobium kwangyangense]|uniref:ABC-F family ATP-binding cassette domain-containing protein n=1 Tax=Aestuariimicrobium kwangyangense TaxID=396389 RepID=UPI00047B48E6|nr:ABC-F family ATP-binding cassette domain-containing protein [Aestuariimicrobium kwangyangense]